MPNLKPSLLPLLAALTVEQRLEFLKSLDEKSLGAFQHLWRLWARPKQLPPPTNWQVWLLMAGRGFGKTRAGAEWIRGLAEGAGQPELGLVGATFDDVRQVMVEGPSGVLSISPKGGRPQWFVSRRLLVWPNGVRATVFSADRPDQLRGPEFGYVWADEIAKWRYEEAWINLRLCMRKGQRPQILATTTPRPKDWLKKLAEDSATALVTGSSAENAANLAPGFAESLRTQLQSKDLIRQELEGALLSAYAGALWARSQLEEAVRVMPARTQLTRCVVGVDPAIGGGDETGIIVAAKDNTGSYWVLEDASCHASAEKWAAKVARMAEKWRVEAIVAEVNQGGDLVRHLLQSAHNPKTALPPVRPARALRGKTDRALPIAAAYARDEVRHAGEFTVLCDQMVMCVPGVISRASPDRLDALVWALSYLMRGAETSSEELRL